MLHSLLQNFKDIKDKLISPLAVFTYKKLHLTSNLITSLSFISGLISILFLFKNHQLFILFIIISVFLDILDGSVARIENKSDIELKRGVLLDDLADRSIVVLILAKIMSHTDITALVFIIPLYILIKGIHIFLKQKIDINIKLIYIDRIPLIFFIFQEYHIGIYIIAFSLLINLLEASLKQYKKT